MYDISCKADQSAERIYTKRQLLISESKHKMPSKQYTQHDFDSAKQTIVFSDYQNAKWMYAMFTTAYNDINEEEEPVYDNSKWNRSENIVSGHECRGIIFKGDCLVNYGIAFMKMKCNIRLARESEFWLFLRGKGERGGCTAVIRISNDDKEEDYIGTLPRITVALGSYFNVKGRERSQLVFLRKEQVVPHAPKSIRSGNVKIGIKEAEALKVEVVDDGKECIRVKVEVNECGYVNEVKGDFFVPTNCEGNVLFAGSGHKCAIDYLAYETDLHRNLDKDAGDEDKKGEGCGLF